MAFVSFLAEDSLSARDLAWFSFVATGPSRGSRVSRCFEQVIGLTGQGWTSEIRVSSEATARKIDGETWSWCHLLIPDWEMVRFVFSFGGFQKCVSYQRLPHANIYYVSCMQRSTSFNLGFWVQRVTTCLPGLCTGAAMHQQTKIISRTNNPGLGSTTGCRRSAFVRLVESWWCVASICSNARNWLNYWLLPARDDHRHEAGAESIFRAFPVSHGCQGIPRRNSHGTAGIRTSRREAGMRRPLHRSRCSAHCPIVCLSRCSSPSPHGSAEIIRNF